MTIVQAGLLAAFVTASPSAAELARKQALGDVRGAAQDARLALASRPHDVTLRLLAVSAAIEAGQLREASDLLAPLERATPPPARAAVLRALLERRSRSSTEPLMLALASAWHAAGRPDLSEDEPLMDPGRDGQLLPSLAKLEPVERVLFDLPYGPDSEPERFRVLASAAPQLREAPPVAALQVLGALTHLECPANPVELNAVADRALEAARRASPTNGYVELAGLLARCPRTLGSAEIDQLTRIAKMPVFEYPRQAAFEQLSTMASRLDPEHSRVRAIGAWLALEVAGMQLRDLVRAQPDPRSRKLGTRATAQIGRRLTEGSGWLERMMGVSLAREGISCSTGERPSAAPETNAETHAAPYRRWSEAMRRLGRWPFAAAWKEWTPDEVEASRRLLAAIGESG